MGKVQQIFSHGQPGSVSRSIDDIIISIKNASDSDIPFGAPVFLEGYGDGAAPFSTENPQDFSTFLGFAVRVADKTPDAYPQGQFNDGTGEGEVGKWKAGDLMEVLVRGSIAIPLSATGSPGGHVYIRKSDGKLTASAGASGSSVLLENVRIRRSRNAYSACCEAVVKERNIL